MSKPRFQQSAAEPTCCNRHLTLPPNITSFSSLVDDIIHSTTEKSMKVMSEISRRSPVIAAPAAVPEIAVWNRQSRHVSGSKFFKHTYKIQFHRRHPTSSPIKSTFSSRRISDIARIMVSEFLFPYFYLVCVNIFKADFSGGNGLSANLPMLPLLPWLGSLNFFSSLAL